MRRSAVISDDGAYRYTLSRRWSRGPAILWIMLNPSTADQETDDPTTRRCIAFSRGWGFGGMTVVNLFALRSPRPAALRTHVDPIGPANDAHIEAVAARVKAIVAAWGTFGWAAERARHVAAILDRPLLCLSTTASGAPRHPLYAPGLLRPRPYRSTPAAAASPSA